MSAMRCVQTGNERILQPGDIPDYSGKIRDRISHLQIKRTASTGIRTGRSDLKNVTGYLEKLKKNVAENVTELLAKVDEKGRMNRYENAFLWLSDAGVALSSYNVNEPQPPLQLNEKRSLFKLFMGDTGLLCAACMENIQFEILKGNLDVNMGSILENVFAQSIKSKGFHLNYFESKKYGELDFVVQNGMKVDLLEIKSGNDYKKHSALSKVSAVENWKFGRKIVFCKGNVQKENGIEYLPWYMVMFYETEQQPKEFIYEVDLSALL